MTLMAMDINLSLIFSILGVHLLAVMSPGPDFVLVTKNALSFSRKAGIYTALGIGLGITIHITYSLAGLGLVLTHNRILFRVIQIIGALYLGYIGVLSLYAVITNKHQKLAKAENLEADLPAAKALRMGFITNVFNPKVGLFFVSIFTQFFQHSQSIATKTIVALSLTLVTIIYFSLVSYGITIPKIKMLYLRIEHFIEIIFSLALLAIATSLLFF